MTSVLQDLLDEELQESDKSIEIEKIFDFNFTTGHRDLGRSKTLGESKSLLEFHELVRQVINDYEIRAGTTEENRVLFTEEEPDFEATNESIVFGLVRREPGSWQQGAPMEARTKNRRPLIREESNDPLHPTYRKVVLGYYYDNVVRYTCWARTNKAANARAIWFEDMMEEYAWWFKLKGVQRVLYHGQDTDLVIERNGNRWYGRPIDFYVRTEKLRVFSEKMLEDILVKLTVEND